MTNEQIFIVLNGWVKMIILHSFIPSRFELLRTGMHDSTFAFSSLLESVFDQIFETAARGESMVHARLEWKLQ